MKTPTNPVVLWLKIKPLLHNPKAPCATKLKKGLEERVKYPLGAGLYKLQEAKHRMGQCLEEFELLANLLKRKEPLRGLCTYGDHAPWIKERPLSIAYELGWKVLPAIEALIGDGVSAHEIAQHSPALLQGVATLVTQCEVVLPNIKGPIRYEYERWRNDDSIITPLLQSGLRIIESAVYMAKKDVFA